MQAGSTDDPRHKGADTTVQLEQWNEAARQRHELATEQRNQAGR